MNIGLYFGSFNPIHIGHLAIANYLVEFGPIDSLWFVVSPHNPLKKKQNLLDDYQRLELVHRAIQGDERFEVSSVEFYLPKPSYTIDTLTYLQEKHPRQRFTLLMGSDNLINLHKWKNYEQILENYRILVYPRPGVDPSDCISHPNIETIQAPLMEISSSFIRDALSLGKDVRYFMPPRSYQYLDEMGFYRR